MFWLHFFSSLKILGDTICFVKLSVLGKSIILFLRCQIKLIMFSEIESWNLSLPAASLYCTCTQSFQVIIRLMHKAGYNVVITIPLNISLAFSRYTHELLIVSGFIVNTTGAKQNKDVSTVEPFHNGHLEDGEK